MTEEQAPKIVEKAARATDDEATSQAQNRVLRTGGGLMIVVAGLGFAFWRPEMAIGPAPVGFWVALIGGGILEPTTVFKMLRPKP